MARAVATDPKIILADEPTGDLDRDTADSVLETLQRLNHELEKTILMVTHDPQAASYAAKTIHLDKGKLQPLHTAWSFTNTSHQRRILY